MASIDSFMRERRRYHEPRRYAAQRQRQGRRSSSAPGYLLSACLIGALAGGGWSLTDPDRRQAFVARSEEHTSELQSLMRTSYAVFRLIIQITPAHIKNNNKAV